MTDYPDDLQLQAAAVEQATKAAEDDALYDRLFGKPKPIPLSDEDRETYEALYGPGTGGDHA